MTENNSLTGSLNIKGDKKTIEFIENFEHNFNPDDFKNNTEILLKTIKKNNRVILTNLNQSNPEHFEILKKLMVSHFRQNYTAGEQQLRQLAINELITKVFKDKAQSESKFNTRDFISDIAKSFLDGSYKDTDELPNNTIFYTLKTGARIDFFQNKIKNILLKIIQYLKEKEITQQEKEKEKEITQEQEEKDNNLDNLEKRLTKLRNKDDDNTEAVIEESVRNMDTFKFKIMEIYYEKNIIQFFKLITELLKDDYFLSILIYYDNTEKYNSINDAFNNLTKEIEQRQQRDIENNLRIKQEEEILLRAITKKNIDKLESEKKQIIKKYDEESQQIIEEFFKKNKINNEINDTLKMRLHNLRRGDINFDYNMLQNEIKTLTNELKSLENNHIENTNKENINNEDNVNTIPDDSDDDSSSQNNERTL